MEKHIQVPLREQDIEELKAGDLRISDRNHIHSQRTPHIKECMIP